MTEHGPVIEPQASAITSLSCLRSRIHPAHDAAPLGRGNFCHRTRGLAFAPSVFGNFEPTVLRAAPIVSIGARGIAG
jgi:hypothetical protein